MKLSSVLDDKARRAIRSRAKAMQHLVRRATMVERLAVESLSWHETRGKEHWELTIELRSSGQPIGHYWSEQLPNGRLKHWVTWKGVGDA